MKGTRVAKQAAKQKPPALAVQGGLWLESKGETLVGAQRIDLLEAIEQHGSITRAAQAISLSYKAAWDSVEAMNNLSEHPLLIRSTGGASGGGTRLTEHGRELVRLYRLLESGYRRLLEQMQAQVHDVPRLSELLRTITMRTSARNQFRGKVTAVRRGAVNCDVILDLGDGLTVCANITNEAVTELQLQPGRDAVALIKSSFVLLTPEANPRISARNRLRGTVATIVPGAVNAEVKLSLPGERVLTAVITMEALEELQLEPGADCTALIKASHVLIAVND
ncbi:MAG TPA: TOBE domain-containing protein [Steroidobacteraceae bacterium]|nr:TOBE domain-containing protein [Steroidobacteraceae bacterium]